MASRVQVMKDAVGRAGSRYTRLVLLVGPGGTGKSATLRELANDLGLQPVNLGLELSRRLVDVPARRRPVAAADLAADLCRGDGADSVRVLDNTEAIFQPELRLDPLKLLQDSARNRSVVAAWCGEVEGGTLRYARPSHAEFREYVNPDAVLVEMAALPRERA